MPCVSNRRCEQCGHEFAALCRLIAMRHATAKKVYFFFWFALMALTIVGMGAAATYLRP